MVKVPSTRLVDHPILNPLISIILLGLTFLSGCIHDKSAEPSLSLQNQIYLPPEAGHQRADFTARSKKDMVVSAHPLASQAGIAMLDRGGNAVDAMVASSFALAVVRPQSTGIGGGGFALLYTPDTKKVHTYDFRERAPRKATRDMFLDDEGDPASFHIGQVSIPRASINGHLAAGVPGMVHGLLEIHEKFGQLPLKNVMQPAIDLAEKGFPVYPYLSRAIARREKTLAAIPASREIFMPRGKPLQAGEQLVQKDLGKTLRMVMQEGAAAFYEGEIATKITASMQKYGGLIDQVDLKNYQTIERQAIRGSYRGYEIMSMPPPSSGGVHLVQMLNILENFSAPQNINDPDWMQKLIESMRFAYADRAHYLGDTDFVKVPVTGLTSKAYAEQLARRIVSHQAGDSDRIKHGNPLPYESASTTHLSVIDHEGMIVTSTQTINTSLGSGAVVAGTGILLNNEMDDFSIKPGLPNAFGLIGSEANAIEAGKTMLSSMSPTLVFQNSKPRLVLGSPGGSRIITAVLQTIINYIDFDLSLSDAVHRYRLHHQWQPDKVYTEAPPDELPYGPELLRMNYKVQKTSFYLGDVQAIAIEDDGTLIGVSDTRGDGKPMTTAEETSIDP